MAEPEQVDQKLYDDVFSELSTFESYDGQDEAMGDALHDLTRRVTDLLSRSAAEPPSEQEQERVRVELTPDDLDGGFVAECVSLPGCVSQGDTVPEALVNIADAYAAIEVARLKRQVGEEVNRRDAAEEWADKLAHAIAGPDEIGEHSNTNSPWANALAIAEARGVAAGPQATPQAPTLAERIATKQDEIEELGFVLDPDYNQDNQP